MEAQQEKRSAVSSEPLPSPHHTAHAVKLAQKLCSLSVGIFIALLPFFYGTKARKVTAKQQVVEREQYRHWVLLLSPKPAL